MHFKKPIYLCLQGPSIKTLEDNVEYFKEHDVLWASLNRFSIVQKGVLDKIDKKFDIVYCSSKERFSQEYYNLKFFNGTIISNYEIAFYTDIKISILSNYGYGFSSLFACLATFLSLGCPAIYLFGADGEAKQTVYYGQDEYKDEDFKARTTSIKTDTVVMNKLFWFLMKYWGIPKGQIVNVCPSSAIECFDKVDIKSLI